MATVAILVYDGFDLIDAGGPYEVFLTAARLQERAGEPAGFEVVLVSPDGADATAYGGMTLTGLSSPQAVDRVDVVVIPGTIDVTAALADPDIGGAVRALTNGADLVTSVCTGAFLLAQAGVLQGLPATTHWEDTDLLAARGDTGAVQTGRRWVDAGSVVTSGGLTSGMHMALHVVGRLASKELAVATARQLDMPFALDGNWSS